MHMNIYNIYYSETSTLRLIVRLFPCLNKACQFHATSYLRQTSHRIQSKLRLSICIVNIMYLNTSSW